MDRLIEASTLFAWLVACSFSFMILITLADMLCHIDTPDFRPPKMRVMFLISLACWAWIISG